MKKTTIRAFLAVAIMLVCMLSLTACEKKFSEMTPEEKAKAMETMDADEMNEVIAEAMSAEETAKPEETEAETEFDTPEKVIINKMNDIISKGKSEEKYESYQIALKSAGLEWETPLYSESDFEYFYLDKMDSPRGVICTYYVICKDKVLGKATVWERTDKLTEKITYEYYGIYFCKTDVELAQWNEDYQSRK